MPGVSGKEIVVAVKKAAAWNTAVACGAGDGILVLPYSIKRGQGTDIDDSCGTFFSLDGSPVQVDCNGQIPAYLRFDSLDVLIANFMGVAGLPAQQGATTAYNYAYKWLKDRSGKFLTFAGNLKNYVEEVPTFKVVGMTIKGESTKPLQIIFDITGTDKVPNSATNTTGTMASVTYTETANRVLFRHGVFRMNDASGAALAVGDKIYPSSFELSAKRKEAGVYTGQFLSNGHEVIDEPQMDGVPEVKLKLGFPRHTANTRILDLVNDTRKKLDMVFTGGLIASTFYRTFGLQLPHLQPINADIAIENGTIKEPLEYICHGAMVAPSGMTGCTDPFWITGTNKRSTDPLA